MELQSLLLKLRKWDNAYYKGTPLLKDAQYDIAFNKALELHKKEPTKESKEYFSTRGYSKDLLDKAKSKGRRNIELPVPMLSLKKVNTDHYKNIPKFLDTLDSYYYTMLKVVKKQNKTKPLSSGMLPKNEMENSIESLLLYNNTDSNKQPLPIHYIVSPKLDGLSLAIHYKNGKLYKAYTGGDGYIGQDKTLHAIALANTDISHGIPLTINTKKEVVIKGELVVNVMAFKMHWKNTTDPRSCISHYLNGDKPLEKHYGIQFIAYESKQIVRDENKDIDNVINYPNSLFKDSIYKFLIQNNFISISTLKCFGYLLNSCNTKVTTTVIMEYLSALSNIQKNIHTYLKADEKDINSSLMGYVHSLPYLCDGIVLDTRFRYVQSKLGYNEAYPNYAIAIKELPSEQLGDTATVTEVIYETSKSGALKPVVHFEPINIGGVNITKASGIHYKNIIENSVGKGSEITVVRSGGVIPRIVKFHNKGKVIKLDKMTCDCGSSLVQHSTDIYCSNKNCPIIKTAIMRNAVYLAGVKGIGGKTVDKLSQDYTLEEFLTTKDDFTKYGNSISKTIKEVQKTILKMSLPNLMAISGVFTDKTMSLSLKLLEVACEESNNCKNLDNLYTVKGFGEKRADFFIKSLPRFKKFYKTVKS